MKRLFTLVLLTTFLSAGRYDTVKITEEISDILVYHKGKATRIHRIQDVNHRLTGSYAKLLHPCPGMCIQPVKIDSAIETVGEIEVIDFIKNRVNKKRGVIIDARSYEAYTEQAIPSAVNIPIEVIKDETAMKEIVLALGMKQSPSGKWNGRRAMDLVVYCDGPLCSKSTQLINALVKLGYPAQKISYYRGGFQMWKILGFTTVISK